MGGVGKLHLALPYRGSVITSCQGPTIRPFRIHRQGRHACRVVIHPFNKSAVDMDPEIRKEDLPWRPLKLAFDPEENTIGLDGSICVLCKRFFFVLVQNRTLIREGLILGIT